MMWFQSLNTHTYATLHAWPPEFDPSCAQSIAIKLSFKNIIFQYNIFIFIIYLYLFIIYFKIFNLRSSSLLRHTLFKEFEWVIALYYSFVLIILLTKTLFSFQKQTCLQSWNLSLTKTSVHYYPKSGFNSLEPEYLKYFQVRR